jgi:hypothetical protein
VSQLINLTKSEDTEGEESEELIAGEKVFDEK